MCLLSVALIAAVSAGELPVIDSSDGFSEYLSAANCRVVKSGGVLRATDIGTDMAMVFRVPRFFGLSADRVSFTYRAQGTGGGGGEIFFAGPFDDFAQERMLGVPPIKADGEWHTANLDTTKARKGCWANAGLITRLRLDPVNTVGGTFELKELRIWNSKQAVGAKPSEADAAFAAKWDAPQWPDVVSEIPLTNGLDLAERKTYEPVDVVCSGGTVEPYEVRAGEKAVLRFDFSGGVPKRPDALKLNLVAGEEPAWKMAVKLSDDMICRLSEKRWRVRFEVEMPLYLDTRTYTAILDWPQVRVVGGRPAEVDFRLLRTERIAGYEHPVRSSVESVAGIPYFTRDGKPFYALWATGGLYPGRRPYDSTRHSSAKMDLVTIWPNPRQVWPRDGVFNPLIYDNYVEYARRSHGTHTMFMVEIPLYPPPDWTAANPDEMCWSEDGKVNRDGGSMMPNYSFASKKARAKMLETLEKAIAYLESSPYANRIFGYRIASGHTYEWLGWDPKPWGKLLDFSPVAKKGFADYMARHYPDVADRSVPRRDERYAHDHNLFADLKANPRAKAYYDYYCEELADAMIAVCSRAKELLGGRKVVGTYYGYTMTLYTGDQMRAHYALEKVLKSGAVDFLMSPQPYDIRQPGCICGDMKPFSSLQANGILSVLEDDTRTHMHMMRGYGYHQTPTEELTIGVMRRNMGNDLCRGQPCYTLCMNDGVNFDYPQFAADARALKRAGELALRAKAGRLAEIAVVVSEDAIKAMPRYNHATGCTGLDRYPDLWQQYQANGKVKRVFELGRSPVISECYQYVFTRLARLGAPVDYILAEDLAKARKDYRLYVFMNCSYASDSFVRAVADLRGRACTMLWAHAPGYMSARGCGTDTMRQLTGVAFEELPGKFDPATKLAGGEVTGKTGNGADGPFFAMKDPDEVLGTYVANGKPALALKRVGRALVAHSGSYRLQMPLLRTVAAKAGVFAFSDSGDPVEANEAFVSLHARFPGRKTIRLPKKCTVVDVFGRTLVARDVDTFSFDAPLHSSWLFCYGDFAEEILKEGFEK